MKKSKRKLSLNKSTVSNLNKAEMFRRLGGTPTNGRKCNTTHCETNTCYFCTYACSQTACGSGPHGCVCTTA